MHTPSGGIFIRGVSLALTLLAVAAVAWWSWSVRAELALHLPVLALLASCSAIAAWITAGRDPEPLATRLAPAFVLAAVMVIPGPGALLVALPAFAGGLGAGVSGPVRRESHGLLGLMAGVALAMAIHHALAAQVDAAGLAGLAEIVVLYGAIQLLPYGVDRLIPRSGDDLTRPEYESGLTLIELVNIPLAWLIVALLSRSLTLPSLALCALILLGDGAARYLAGLRRKQYRSEEIIGARITELETLHAVARETLSTLDPQRILPIVERECEKIFPMDGLCFARLDRESHRLELVYGADRGPEEESAQAWVATGLAESVHWEKHGVRLDDARASANAPANAPRSVLAVPLIVENEVIGVLSIYHADRAAYDDHQLSVFTTIGQQIAAAMENARHYEMATIDALTGLYLRPHFFRRVEEEYNRARRYKGTFSVLMLDLDGFKAINDSHGHLAGDHYLRALGDTVGERLRSADLGCRYGGDEFCLLLPETDLAGARAIAERIRTAVAGLVVQVDSIPVRTTVSIGLASYPEHGADALNSLLRRADEALYRAKRQGRDRVVLWAA